MADLATIFQMQKDLNDEIIKKKQPTWQLPSEVAKEDDHNNEKARWIDRYICAAASELFEARQLISAAKWWSTKTGFDKPKLQEELIDVMHFLVSAMLMSGMSAEDVFETYKAKHAINQKRASTQSY